MILVTIREEILFLLVVFGANVIQGITGFAGTLLAMPASILLIGPDKAKAILNVMAVLSCAIIVGQSYRQIDVRELGKIIAGMAVGMALGMELYALLPLSFLLPLYGAFIIAVGVRNIAAKKAPSFSRKEAWAVLLGAGIVHGMFVSGGALLVVYAAAAFKDKEVFRSTLSAVWVILNLFLMGKDFLSGIYDHDVLVLTAVSIPPLLAAIYAGTVIHRHMGQAVFMKVSYGLLILSGVMLL